MITSNQFKPDLLITPGATLLETIEALGMSQSELSIRMQRPEKTISGIINGTTAITTETALQFERVLGIPASFWSKLQSNYDEQITRVNVLETINKEFRLVNTFPYQEMVHHKWVQATSKIEEMTENLLTFFGVDSLAILPQLGYVQFRKLNGKKISEEALAAWLRQGEKEAIQMQTAPFDKTKLKEIINRLREFTIKEPQGFNNQARELLASCGVAFVAVPMLKNTYVNGAAKWLSSDKALVQLSLRGRYADIFWFTLFHELGHITLHGKKDSFVDTDNIDDTKKENEANEFSCELLIPKDKYLTFIESNKFDVQSIRQFASDLNVHPGIIVGRLQHDKHLKFNELNSLREKYKFVQE